MDYLLDSNIIVIYSRDNDISNLIEQRYQLFSGDHRLFVSIPLLKQFKVNLPKLNKCKF